MKHRFLGLLIFSLLIVTGCGEEKSQDVTSHPIAMTSIEEQEARMRLFIDQQEVAVNWEKNPSVEALRALAANTLTISMHEYGGFEQTGMIGQSIVRDDEQINVVPGDVVLYQGNQISVFYHESSWSYTRLGHISLSREELRNMLEKNR